MKKTLMMLGLGASLAQSVEASCSARDDALVTLVRTKGASTWQGESIPEQFQQTFESFPGHIEVTLDGDRAPSALMLRGSEEPTSGARAHHPLTTAHMAELSRFLEAHKATLTVFHMAGYTVRGDLGQELGKNLATLTQLASLTLEENAIPAHSLASVLSLLSRVSSFALLDTSRFHDWPETFVPDLTTAVEAAPRLRHFSLAVPPMRQASLENLVEALGAKKGIEVSLTFPSAARELCTQTLKSYLGDNPVITDTPKALTVCASPVRARH
ncbi:MAG: hypothetical protein C0514_03840 [Candidatus Puniceispirillum sp.]|nr:hypothetical protein [Candidatus Puniceispirillum sp.]